MKEALKRRYGCISFSPTAETKTGSGPEEQASLAKDQPGSGVIPASVRICDEIGASGHIPVKPLANDQQAVNSFDDIGRHTSYINRHTCQMDFLIENGKPLFRYENN